MITKETERIVRLAAGAIRDFRTTDNPDAEAYLEVDARLPDRTTRHDAPNITVSIWSQNLHADGECVTVDASPGGLATLRETVKHLAVAYDIDQSVRPYQGHITDDSRNFSDLVELMTNYGTELEAEGYPTKSETDGETVVNMTYNLRSRSVKSEGVLVVVHDSIMREFNVHGVVADDTLEQCADLIGERVVEVLENVSMERSEHEAEVKALARLSPDDDACNDLSDEYWSALLFDMRDARWTAEKRARADAKLAKAA